LAPLSTTSTLIVPTLNGARVERLLRSLAPTAPGNLQVLVVDNGSRDPQIDQAVAELADVHVLRLETNVGFSRAVNLAAARAEGDALVLVNDDCICDPGFLERIVAALDPAAAITMAAGVMREARDPSRIDTAGIELDRTLLAFDYLNGEPVTCVDEGVLDPIGPSGTAAAYDRQAFLDVGGFDQNLFAYWEDVDLALRLLRDGGRCRLARTARGTHEHSSTFGSGSARKDYLMGFGRGYLLRKWGVLRRPSRAIRALATDVVICLGQVVIDRNLAGVAGRVRGYRAGRLAEDFPYEAIASQAWRDGETGTLRRRLKRRMRLRQAANGRPQERPRVLAVFHTAEPSGPLRSLEAELRWVADVASLTIVAPGPGGVADTFAGTASVTQREYGPLMLPSGPLGLPRALVQLGRDARTFEALIDEEHPGLVVVVSTLLPSALIAARRRRVPFVVYAAELHRGSQVESALRRIGGAILVRLIDRWGSTTIACSDVVAAQFRALRRPRTPLVTIYPPIADAFRGGDGDAFCDRYEIPAAASCIVTVGNVTPGRGQDLLIEALPVIRAAVPGVHCVIVGPTFQRPKDIRFEAALRELARERGVAAAVTFTGAVGHIADAYAAAAVVVNPARTPESFGRVGCEALAAGRPVVATRVGGVREALPHGGAVRLVPPEDSAALGDAVIGFLLDSDGAKAATRAAAAEVLARFAPERSLDAFREVVGTVLPTASERPR
jgi:N-acetylglucosaminyl-diphospho-decaprenol L-rhamnosyltransferase